jgi:hypothetical protein
MDDAHIDEAFSGHGVAIRREDESPIPGEPFMSMAEAKAICSRLLDAQAAALSSLPSAVPEAGSKVAKMVGLLRLNLHHEDRRMAIENCDALISYLETGAMPNDLSSARELSASIKSRIEQADEGGAGEGFGVHLVRQVGASLTALSPSEGAIPAGMAPWSGGDSAPEDWDGGPVKFRGYLGLIDPKNPFRWWHGPVGDPHDIVAYMTKASREGFVSRLESQCELAEKLGGTDQLTYVMVSDLRAAIRALPAYTPKATPSEGRGGEEEDGDLQPLIDHVAKAIADPGRYCDFRSDKGMPQWQAEAAVLAVFAHADSALSRGGVSLPDREAGK